MQMQFFVGENGNFRMQFETMILTVCRRHKGLDLSRIHLELIITKMVYWDVRHDIIALTIAAFLF